jgi:PHD/YefM family antitoxin component YafN of YafNO toxin-antitoxin module
LESNSVLEEIESEAIHGPESRHPFADRFQEEHPAFLQQLKETGEPVVLTVNGKAELVVQDAASYQKLLRIAEEARALEGIRRGLEDVRGGRTRPLAEAFADIRRELDLPERS